MTQLKNFVFDIAIEDSAWDTPEGGNKKSLIVTFEDLDDVVAGLLAAELTRFAQHHDHLFSERCTVDE